MSLTNIHLFNKNVFYDKVNKNCDKVNKNIVIFYMICYNYLEGIVTPI